MSTDKELLELAAKAGGYDVAWNEHWQCFQHRNPSPDKLGNVRHPWVPLDDDGDALRLAVKLLMSVTVFEDGIGIGMRDHGYQEYDIHPDMALATRRAIVRAAAEIGRGM
ncbi:MAG: hypothetical protein ACRCUB_00925 [Plesiomonas shigelloides]